MLTEEHLLRGKSADEARREARLELGGFAQLREAHREVREMQFLSDSWRVLRHALRSLRRTPSFTLTALAILSIGIGATTAVFSVVNSVLIKPLPYPDAERLT